MTEWSSKLKPTNSKFISLFLHLHRRKSQNMGTRTPNSWSQESMMSLKHLSCPYKMQLVLQRRQVQFFFFFGNDYSKEIHAISKTISDKQKCAQEFFSVLKENRATFWLSKKKCPHVSYVFAERAGYYCLQIDRVHLITYQKRTQHRN